MNDCAALTCGLINAQEDGHPCKQRILLRYWGGAEGQVLGLTKQLPNFNGRVMWTDEESRIAHPDLVIHMIDPSYSKKAHEGDLEPAAAMRRAFRRGGKEIALLLGSASELPQKRYGSWITAGRRSTREALDIIARTLVEPALNPDCKHRWNLHDLAETNMLCVLATESAGTREALARQIIAAVGTALGLSYAAPTRIIVTAPEAVIADITTSYPINRERVNLIRRVAAADDFSADMLVVYPWPAGMLK